MRRFGSLDENSTRFWLIRALMGDYGPGGGFAAPGVAPGVAAAAPPAASPAAAAVLNGGAALPDNVINQLSDDTFAPPGGGAGQEALAGPGRFAGAVAKPTGGVGGFPGANAGNITAAAADAQDLSGRMPGAVAGTRGVPGGFYPSDFGTGSGSLAEAAFMPDGGSGFAGQSNQLRPELTEAQHTKRPGSGRQGNPLSRGYSKRPYLPRGTCRIRIDPPKAPGRMPRKTTKEGLWAHALGEGQTSFRTGSPENAPIEFDLSRYRRAFQAGCEKVLDSAQKPGDVLFSAIHKSYRNRGRAVTVNTRLKWQTDVSGVGEVNFSIIGTVLSEGNRWVFKGRIAPLPELFDFNRRKPGARKWYRELAAWAGRRGKDVSHVRPFKVYYVGSAYVEASGRLPNR